jgi:hypothetical protein
MKVQAQFSHLAISQRWEVSFLVLNGLIGRRGSACIVQLDVRTMNKKCGREGERFSTIFDFIDVDSSCSTCKTSTPTQSSLGRPRPWRIKDRMFVFCDTSRCSMFPALFCDFRRPSCGRVYAILHCYWGYRLGVTTHWRGCTTEYERSGSLLRIHIQNRNCLRIYCSAWA